MRGRSVTMHVAAVGHADHCHTCCLWPCTLPLWARCVAPGPTVQLCKRKKKLVKKTKTKKKNTPKSYFIVFIAITEGSKLLALKP